MHGCDPPLNRVVEVEVANQKQNKSHWQSKTSTGENKEMPLRVCFNRASFKSLFTSACFMPSGQENQLM